MREILQLVNDLPEQAAPDKTALLREGEKTGRVYVLAAGRLEVLRGGTQIAVLDEPGSLVGEMAALLDSPHTATVLALGEARVHVIDDGAAYFASHPELSWLVARLLARRLNAASTYLVDLKRQFAGYGNHLELVGEVLETLMHAQATGSRQASDRDGYDG